jgi:glycosyltransferase involved in cell wall biosynthesis
MDIQKPLISIITVSLNSSKTIEKTILSVLNQTYKNIEYIIIDGDSTDGTIDIIKKYQDRISYWKSEKDDGIFDAMNKGTHLAHGVYLNFMNSDDYFFNDTIIEESLPYLNGQNDIVYGNMEVRYKNFKFIKEESKPKYLWMGPVNHQSSFIKKETLDKYKYNTKNKLLADYEFFLNVYYSKGKILKIKKIIASYSSEGISGQNNDQVIIDSHKTISKFKKNIIINLYYEFLKSKPLIKKILPGFIFKIFKKIINKIFS